MTRKLSILLAILLAGCNFGPNIPARQALPLPGTFSEPTGSLGGRTAVPAVAQERWWEAFGDPVLDRMIAAGIAGNLDLQQAQARIAAADANVTAAGSGLLPKLVGGASHEESRENGSMREVNGVVHTTAGRLGAEWLLDLFGQVRSQVGSAEARREAVRASGAVARLALISGLSNAYVDARYQQELYRIAERHLAAANRTAELTRRRHGEGVASELDIASADVAVAEAAAELPLREADFRRAANRAATLMGRPAGEVLPDLQAGGRQPVSSFVADMGVPADLLRNRPDVRVAEMEFQGAVSDIGFAWSQLFPSVTLSGTITPSYIDTQAASGSLTKWAFGPSIRIPIFEGGRLIADLRAAEARAVEKEAGWRNAVLKAVEDVENALVSYNRQQKAAEAAGRQLAGAAKAATLSQAVYREGVSSLLPALEAERRHQEAAAALALARRNLALQFIALNVAVGRGLPGPGTAATAVASR